MAGWTFTAPAGTTISHAALARDFYKRGDDTWFLFVSDQSGSQIPSQNCMIDPAVEYQCEIAGTLDLSDLTDTALSVGVLCTGGSCVNGALSHDVRADLDSAVVTISAPTPPSPTTASGPLTQAGWHSGTAGLNLSSTDPVGLSQMQAERVDGTVLASAALPCDYTYPVPCRQATAVPVQIDTTRLPDGIDPLALVATDAAQNTTVSTIDLMIANHAPPAPRLTGAPTGSTAQASATITAQLSSEGVPISTLDWVLCGSTCGPPTVLTVPPGAAGLTFKVTAPRDGAYSIAAYATDAAGHRSVAGTEPFDVDRGRPAVAGSGSGPTLTGKAGPGSAETLPAGAKASLTLPPLIGRAGDRLRLSLRRRPHRRIELDVRASPPRTGHLVVALAFGGHRAKRHRLTLRRGAASVAVPIPARATRLTIAVTGLGLSATDHVRLVRLNA